MSASGHVHYTRYKTESEGSLRRHLASEHKGEERTGLPCLDWAGLESEHRRMHEEEVPLARNQLITDGFYRKGDRVLLEGTVLGVDLGQRWMNVVPEGTPEFIQVPTKAHGRVLSRAKTPGQVLWEEIRKDRADAHPMLPWKALTEPVREKYERMARAVRNVEE